MKPAVVHREIKPSNVSIEKIEGVTVETHVVDDPARWARIVRALSSLLDNEDDSGQR